MFNIESQKMSNFIEVLIGQKITIFFETSYETYEKISKKSIFSKHDSKTHKIYMFVVTHIVKEMR